MPRRRVTSATLIERQIHVIRDRRVMLDADLAELYGVPTKSLNRAVQRNMARFPADFMFRLENHEVANLRFQFGTSSSPHGGSRYLPLAFTEQGIAMLSSVLRSSRAIGVNIEIMRAFIRMRELLSSNKALAEKLGELEQKIESHDAAIVGIFRTMRELMSPRRATSIGFTADIDAGDKSP